jgi:hypothetical protein
VRRQLIGQTALLEFKLVRTTDEGAVVWNRLDAALAARARAGQVAVDSAVASRPLTSYFMDQYNGGRLHRLDRRAQGLGHARLGAVRRLRSRRSRSALERRRGRSGRTGRWLYVVKREPEMTGGGISSAEMSNRLDQTTPGRVGRLDPLLRQGPGGLRARHRGERRPPARGRARRRRALGALDPRAHPQRQRLDHGLVRLEVGEGPRDRAQGRRAARPGRRSSRSDRSDPRSARTRSTAGFKAAWIGTLLVVAFMVIYYQGSGLIAVAALMLNFILCSPGWRGSSRR